MVMNVTVLRKIGTSSSLFVCGGTGSVSSLTHMSQDCSQFFTLSLSTDVCTQATLQELESTLILGHLQQLHGTSFVGSMADNFAHQIADEFCVLGLNLKRKDVKNIIKGGRKLFE
jgi:hypothetical protein